MRGLLGRTARLALRDRLTGLTGFAGIAPGVEIRLGAVLATGDSFLDRAVVEGIARGLGRITAGTVGGARSTVATGDASGVLTSVGDLRVAGRTVAPERVVAALCAVLDPGVVAASTVTVIVAVVRGHGGSADACAGDTGTCSSGSGVAVLLAGSTSGALASCTIVRDRSAVAGALVVSECLVTGDGCTVAGGPVIDGRAACLVVTHRCVLVLLGCLLSTSGVISPTAAVLLVTVMVTVTVLVAVVGGHGGSADACAGDTGTCCCGSGSGVAVLLAGSTSGALASCTIVLDRSAVAGALVVSECLVAGDGRTLTGSASVIGDRGAITGGPVVAGCAC